MSHEVYNWVSTLRTGDPVSKAVMHAIANWMNPLGEPCQVSMKQLADDVEISTRTAQRHVRRLEEMAFVIRSDAHRANGGQGWSTFLFPGYVPPKSSSVEPPVSVQPITREAGERVGKPPLDPHDNLSPSPGDNLSPPPGDNLTPPHAKPPETALPPCQSVTPPTTDCHGEGDTVVRGGNYKGLKERTPLRPPGGAEEISPKRDRGSRISETWAPPPIAELNGAAQAKARQWPAGAYDAEAQTFRSHWMAEAGRAAHKLDWTAAWVAHINRWTARVLNDAKAGVTFAAPSAAPVAQAPPMAGLDTSREGDAAKKIRKALAKRADGTAIRQFFDKCRFDVNRDGLTIVAPSEFTLSYIRDGSSHEAQLAMHDVLGPDADLKWTVEKQP